MQCFIGVFEVFFFLEVEDHIFDIHKEYVEGMSQEEGKWIKEWGLERQRKGI